MNEGIFSLIIWAVIGFLAQAVDGSLGMGYGVFSTTLVVSTGVIPALASASVHTAETFTTLFSGGSHLIFGNVNKRLLVKLIIPGVAGSVIGALVLTSIPGDFGRLVIAVILFSLGVVITYRYVREQKSIPETKSDQPENKETPVRAANSARMPLLGLIASFIDATGGGGWGSIATTGLMLDGNTEVCQVVGTVNIVEFFITLAAAITFLIRIGWSSYDWPMVGALIVGGVIAAPIAARVCQILPKRVLGILVGLLIVGTNLYTIIQSVL